VGKIRRLPSSLVNQIAAGEVVERPASVVKELVENAIDAGATRVEVVVQKGGQRLIQVGDDGQGMSGEDLAVAFERHATSKISTVDDLTRIDTLGFRGEALPSIASVAQVTTRTCDGGPEGSEIVVHGGKSEGVKPAPPIRGTTVSVKNLFFNTPARRKFLKRPATETQYIIEVLRRFALCYPEVAFTLASDKREIFRLPTSDLQHRIGAVFDPTYQRSVMAVTLDKPPYLVEGYVGSLNLVRGRPKEQYIFLNRRWVQERLLNGAVYGAYRSLVSRGEYPFFVLNLTIPMEEVDVNVHPAKSEVRFRDEWRIYHVVKLAVTEAIKDIPGMIPDFTRPAGGSGFPSQPPFGGVPASQTLAGQTATLFESAPRPAAPGEPGVETAANFEQAAQRIGFDLPPDSPDEGRPVAPYNPEAIWQVHNKYILSQVASGLVLIDQHVAHERVLFEEAQRAFADQALPSQTVLFPQVLEFAADEFSRLMDILPYLEKLGFRIREFGKHTVVIDGVPTDVMWGREREIIKDILDRYQGEKGAEFLDNMAAAYACKAAVKAGDPLTLEEMRTVVDRLFATQNPYYCPHGRPTIVHLPLEEMDRRFERI